MPDLRVDRGVCMLPYEHIPEWAQGVSWDLLPVPDFVTEVLRREGGAGGLVAVSACSRGRVGGGGVGADRPHDVQ